ncbi:MAG: tetratricopeptide repeat protein [Acetobacteraceae bacterium]|nr:tetratricopeptide repeat protein [Acetobacteraceae bacterium]
MTSALRIAFCISGQLRDDHLHFPAIGALARDLDATVFISTWRRRGTKTSGVTNRDQLMRMFGYEVGSALPAPLVGETRFNHAIPDYEATVLSTFHNNEVTIAQLHANIPGAIVDIEDEVMSLDFHAPVPSDRNSVRMLYKIWRCNEIKRAEEKRLGTPFDIVVRFRPDVLPDLSPESLAPLCAEGTAPIALFYRGTPGATHVGDVITVSTSPIADQLARLFARAVDHPDRNWDFIHHEIPRHLRDLGIAIGHVELKQWVTEDSRNNQPRNRRLLLRLLAEGRFDPAFFPKPTTWEATRRLIEAAVALEDGRNRLEVEERIAAIELEQEDTDFLVRTAFVLARAYGRARENAGVYVATLIGLYCRIGTTGDADLTAKETLDELDRLESLAPTLGVTESLAWRSVECCLAPAPSAKTLRQLASAAQLVVGLPGLLQAERMLRAARPALFPVSPNCSDLLDRTMDLIAENRIQDALDTAQKAVANDGADPLPVAYLADLCLSLGNGRVAAQAYAAVASRGAAADMHAMASVAFERSGDADAALAAAQHAAAAAPANPILHARLAGLLRAAGRHAEAEPSWRSALARTPQDPALHHALGQTLLQLGRTTAAREAIAQAASLMPDSPTLRAELQALGEAVLPAPPPPFVRLRAVTPPTPVEPREAAVQTVEPASNTLAWQILRGDAMATPARPTAAPPPAERRGLFSRLFGRGKR